jgi:hypothetical protein
MQLKVQIISYDVLIAGLFFLVRIEKKKFVQIFTYKQNKHTLNQGYCPQIFVQKVQRKKKSYRPVIVPQKRDETMFLL